VRDLRFASDTVLGEMRSFVALIPGAPEEAASSDQKEWEAKKNPNFSQLVLMVFWVESSVAMQS
jgi:hypothetical protein